MGVLQHFPPNFATQKNNIMELQPKGNRKPHGDSSVNTELRGALKPTQFGGLSSGLMLGVVGYALSTPFSDVIDPMKTSTVVRLGLLGMLFLYWIAVVNRRLCEPTPAEAQQR